MITTFIWVSYPVLLMNNFMTLSQKKKKKKMPMGFYNCLLFGTLCSKTILWKSILQVPDTGMSQYWWILEHFWRTSILFENVKFTFFRKCWCYPEAHNTGIQKWSSFVQYSCISIGEGGILDTYSKLPPPPF